MDLTPTNVRKRRTFARDWPEIRNGARERQTRMLKSDYAGDGTLLSPSTKKQGFPVYKESISDQGLFWNFRERQEFCEGRVDWQARA